MKKMALIAAAIFAAMFTAGAQEYFTGEGGAGLSVSVEKPKVQNVGEDVSWLPDYANNVISDDIKKYSRIEVVERRYEGAVSSALAREEGAEYADDDAEVGQWKKAKSQLQVSIIGKSRSYNVSAAVVDKQTLTNQASFNEDCSFDALESGAVLGKAVSSLLGQLGVVLTDKAKGELLSASKQGSNKSIEAQKLVAQAQKAEAAGSNIEALRLSMAASRQDVNLERAAVTKSRVSQVMLSSDMGANARNAIKRHDEMAALVKETREYYLKHPPYTLIYDPELKEGSINYERRQFAVTFKAAVILNPNVMDDYIMIVDALKANPEYKDWKLEEEDIFPFGGAFFYESILNAKGEVVASSKSQVYVENGRVRGGKTVVRHGKQYYIPYPFNSGTFFDTISVDKNTEGLHIRIDKAVNRSSQEATISVFTVEEYCTQVWQGYIDRGSSLPVGIDMFEKYFSNSKGFQRPAAKTTAIPARGGTNNSGAKKDKVDDTVAAEPPENYLLYKSKTIETANDTFDAGEVVAAINGLNKKAKDRKVIVIPKTIKGCSVIGITKNAFKGNETLESIIFAGYSSNGKDRLCSVLTFAFADCTSLKDITIQNGASVYFDSFACIGCTTRKTVTVQENAEAVFHEYSLGRVGSITIHTCANVYFEDKAFWESTSIESLTIQENAEVSFAKSAFKKCTSLKTVTIPASVKCYWYNKDVFKGCTSLSAESKAAILAAGYKGKF